MGEENIFHKLLGDGAAALHDLAGGKVDEEGSQDAVHGDGAVIIKIMVLNGDEGSGCLLYTSDAADER